jgi:hypothetical protein
VLFAIATFFIVLNVVLTAPWQLTGVVGGLDDVVYALGGAEWASGRIPYLQFWDNKPPSIYLLNMVMWRLTGGLSGIWWLSLACDLASVVLLYRICARLYHPTAALLAVTLFVVAMLPFVDPNVVNTFIVLLNIVALDIATRRLAAGRRAASTGVWIGLIWSFSFLLRPNAVLLQSWLVLLLASDLVRRDGVRRAGAFMGFAAAGALAYAVPVIVYFWLHHALPGLLDCVVRFNATYVAGRFGDHIKVLMFGIPIAAGGSVFLAVCASVWVISTRSLQQQPIMRVLEWSLVPLLALEMALASASGRPFGDYFEPPILLVALVVACFVTRLLARLSVSPGVPAAIWPVARACVFAGLLAPGLLWFIDARGATLTGKGFWFNASITQLRDYLRDNAAHGKPGNDKIFVWGNMPGAYLLPGVSADERYSFILPFLIAGYVDQKMVGDLISEMEQRRPRLIIDTSPSDDVPPLASFVPGRVPKEPSWETWQVTPPLARFYDYVRDNYVLDSSSTNGLFLVYRRRNDG